MDRRKQLRGASRASRWLASVALGAVVATSAGCGGQAPNASATGTVSTGTTGPGPLATGAAASIPIPDLANVDLDEARADRVTIGPEGGELEVTDANGVAYWLLVPAGAVAAPTAMAAVPITRLAGQPEGTTLLAGVHFVPEGLAFWKAAELTITLPAPPSAGIVPVAYGGDFVEPYRYPGTVDGASAKLDVVHFSGYALLSSTQQGTSAAEIGLVLAWNPPSGAADRALSEIAAAIDGTGEARQQAIDAALERWLSGIEILVNAFRAQVEWDAFGPYEAKRFPVVSTFELWQSVEKLLVLAGAPPDLVLADRARALATLAAVHGMTVTNSNCNASTTLLLLDARVPGLFAWQEFATALGIVERDPIFDPETLAARSCVQVAFNPEGGTDFPVGIQPGQSGTLALDVGLRVDASNLRFGVGPFLIDLFSDDTDPATDGGYLTDGFGKLTHQVLWDPISPELRIDIQACLQRAFEVCQDAFVVRGTSPEATPAAGCPSFRAGNVQGSTWSSVSASSDSGGAAIGGDMVVSIAMTGGAWQVSGTGSWFVDAASAPEGPQDVTVVWEGEVFWQGGAPGDGGSASATMGANAPSITRSVPAPSSMSPAAIRLEQALRVEHGDVIEITFNATASSSDDEVGLQMTGFLDFRTPTGVSINQTECDD